MRKNRQNILFAFNLTLLGFNLSDACEPINSVSVRQLARVLSENTGNLVDIEDIARMQFQIIQPGTKWCGAGNIAENYDDLGSQRETDMCCRDHDNCPDIIEAGDTRHNLTNEAFYTRVRMRRKRNGSCLDAVLQCMLDANPTMRAGKHRVTIISRLSCKCDEQFRVCLRKTNRRTANSIGTVYFNALATKCFREDYPALKCLRRGGWLNRKCLEYTYDTSAKKLYQWFDVNNY